MRFTEAQLRGFAAPLSDSENERCRHAIGMVRDAMKGLGYVGGDIACLDGATAAYTLEMRKGSSSSVKLLVQGSYANNTNVKAHSDVDVAVICESTFRSKYRYGASGRDYGFSSSGFTARQFKDEVEGALRRKFGEGVERRNKSIKITGNTYRTDADVVPALRYRDYSNDYLNDKEAYIGGIYIVTDEGETIVNYPEQHIRLGREKNVETNHAYKKMTRIAKKMMLLMQEEGIESAQGVSSFVIESLVWNVPNSLFTRHRSLAPVFDDVVSCLQDGKHSLESFKEANGIKPICSDAMTEAALAAFVDDLRDFCEF